MPSRLEYDAVVVGSGPNGLAAAITIAQEGRSVLILEAKDTIGGGTRTEELTLPGFRHDVCSAIHPLALTSPFFRSLDLGAHGLEWIHPPVPLAHPLDDGSAVLLERSLEATAEGLGQDADRYRRLIGPAVRDWDELIPELLKPLGIPRHLFPLLRFGPLAMRSAVETGTLLVQGRQGSSPFCRQFGPRYLSTATPVERGLRAHALYVRPCRWVAHCPWWFPGNCRRSCVLLLVLGGRGQSWSASLVHE